MEEWKLFKPGYESHVRYYEPIYISNLGNIKGRKLFIDGRGYFTFFYKNKKYRLHRIVAKLFIDNPQNKPCIDHINTNKADNRVENLRWCNYKENSNNPLTRKHISESKFKKVQCIETGEIFDSAVFIRNNKNDPKNMSAAIKKNLRLAGYHWRYIDDGTDF